MEVTLGILLFLGMLGAFDTLWYHEWRQRLPVRPTGATELRLHAARDFAYAILFGSLAWTRWQGLLTWLLALLLAFEIGITLWDFIEEDISRPLPPGERVMHTIMAILYGAFLVWLIAVGRRADARALATIVPDCLVLVGRLVRDSQVLAIGHDRVRALR